MDEECHNIYGVSLKSEAFLFYITISNVVFDAMRNVALCVIILYPILSASSQIVYKQFHRPKGHKKCKADTNT